MKKKILFFITLNLFIIFLILTSKSNNNLEIYKFDINDSDLRIENYTIVTNGSEAYISDSYIVGIVGENKNITEVSIIMKNKETILTDFIFEFPNYTEQNAPNDKIISEKINQDTVLTVLLKYKLNNVQKEYYHSIKLKDNKVIRR